MSVRCPVCEIATVRVGSVAERGTYVKHWKAAAGGTRCARVPSLAFRAHWGLIMEG